MWFLLKSTMDCTAVQVFLLCSIAQYTGASKHSTALQHMNRCLDHSTFFMCWKKKSVCHHHLILCCCLLACPTVWDISSCVALPSCLTVWDILCCLVPACLTVWDIPSCVALPSCLTVLPCARLSDSLRHLLWSNSGTWCATPSIWLTWRPPSTLAG